MLKNIKLKVKKIKISIFSFDHATITSPPKVLDLI